MALERDKKEVEGRIVRCCNNQLKKRSRRAAALRPGKHLFSFGVITDVQYADIPDGKSFHGVPRYYRNSLEALRRAVRDWSGKELHFAVHLGDIVDGYHPSDKSDEGLASVTEVFETLKFKTWHTIGNHCLYTAPRGTLHEYLKIPPAKDGASYYDFSPRAGWHIVMLDSYDISVLGWPDEHPKRKLAESILRERNPNENKNSPDGLVGLDRRFVKFGGGISDEQLYWFEEKLRTAKECDERVIVCTHLPLHPRTAHPNSLLWNFEEVKEIITKYAGTVVAAFSGHCHRDSGIIDECGVYYRVLEAVLECPPGCDAYGHVEVYDNCLVLHGVGRLSSARIPFQP